MASSSDKLRVNHSLDVRGLAGPESYRKTVERLKGMVENEILEVTIDEGAVLRTLPFGLRAEGHEILVSEPTNNGVRLLVRKRSLLP